MNENGPMGGNTRATGQTTKRTGQASSCGLMGRSTMEDGRKENSMERASIRQQMGLTGRASGTTVKGLSGLIRLFMQAQEFSF